MITAKASTAASALVSALTRTISRNLSCCLSSNRFSVVMIALIWSVIAVIASAPTSVSTMRRAASKSLFSTSVDRQFQLGELDLDRGIEKADVPLLLGAVPRKLTQFVELPRGLLNPGVIGF